MATDTLQPESEPATAGSNVIPFRRPRTVRIEITSELPDPLAMSPEESEAAWLTLCCYAQEARAYYSYIEERFLLLWRTDQDAASWLYPEREASFDRMGAFADKIASLPVPKSSAKGMIRQHIRRKKRIVGQVWLQAEGKKYDAYRSSIAADEAMLLSGEAL